MDISGIITRLQAECPTFAQIVAAGTGGTLSPVDTQADLYSLLQATVSGEMYPLQLPELPTHPSMVYQMVSSNVGTFEGYDVTKTDIYVVNLRGPVYDDLLPIVDAIVTALDSQTIEITDMLHDYDQSENLFRINMEITSTYIVSASQSKPAAFVYPLDRAGEPSSFDNYTKQRVEATYAILLVTADNNIPALQDEIQNALVGWQQTANHFEMEYSSGANLDGVGNLEMWREVYRDAYFMTQA